MKLFSNNFNYQKLFQLFILIVFISSVSFSRSFLYASQTTTNAEKKSRFIEQAEKNLNKINGLLFKILFFDLSFGSIEKKNTYNEPLLDESGNPQTVTFPFVVILLVAAGIYFTIYHRFVNVKLLKHSLDVIKGKFDKVDSLGSISHFRALTSALSGTIGLGNIAGVAIAIYKGGPGALIWMFIISFFGMTLKFHSTSLALKYREINSKGDPIGGPMYYLKNGFKKTKLAPVGLLLAILFAFFTMGGALGAGNMFQVNQSYTILASSFNIDHPNFSLYFGIVFSLLVGYVIIGGIKSIGKITSKIVPFMCVFYLFICFIVILSNIKELPNAIAIIFQSAFSSNAIYGGILGVFIVGVQRSVFSNEAGLGSASIVHASAKTDEPIREGLVAMVGPIIDTMIVCTTTALVIIITGTWESAPSNGITMTGNALGTFSPWFSKILAIIVLLFAYSTCITWYYYGERGALFIVKQVFSFFTEYQEGKHPILELVTKTVFLAVFLFAIIVGSVNTIGAVLDFSDILILSMAIPNIFGLIFLAPQVKVMLHDYYQRYKENQF